MKSKLKLGSDELSWSSPLIRGLEAAVIVGIGVVVDQRVGSERVGVATHQMLAPVVDELNGWSAFAYNVSLEIDRIHEL